MQSRLTSRLGALRLMRFLTLTFFVLLLTGKLLSAQDTVDSEEVVLKVEGLSAYSYADVYKAFDAHADYTLELACVPAQMLLFRHRSASVLKAEDVARIKQVIAGANASLNAATLLSINREGFDSTCLAYRLGTPNE